MIHVTKQELGPMYEWRRVRCAHGFAIDACYGERFMGRVAVGSVIAACSLCRCLPFPRLPPTRGEGSNSKHPPFQRVS